MKYLIALLVAALLAACGGGDDIDVRVEVPQPPRENAQETPAHPVAPLYSGGHYVRLSQLPRADGRRELAEAHASFAVGVYDREHAAAALDALHGDTVRVFLEGCCVGTMTGASREQYLANVRDFVALAGERGKKVIVTSFDWLPAEYPGGPGGKDYLYLTEAGTRDAERMWGEIISGVGPGRVYAWQIANELFTHSPSTGDDVLRYVNRVSAVIRALDPQAKVTVGFFPEIVSGPDRFVPRIFPALNAADIDFVDLHYYLEWGFSLDEVLADFGGPILKPILLGEIGEMDESKLDGRRFIGWLRWSAEQAKPKVTWSEDWSAEQAKPKVTWSEDWSSTIFGGYVRHNVLRCNGQQADPNLPRGREAQLRGSTWSHFGSGGGTFWVEGSSLRVNTQGAGAVLSWQTFDHTKPIRVEAPITLEKREGAWIGLTLIQD